ncbi:peptidylprolyl isomerase [Candidatus Pacearchaeota archaeon]|jgi:FKBP-type peptidyl-prolyl cis-trans isomerase 2|nr:peptidylprolyl isomerase [Candidatus Pacearchaeota archaeon]|tara:strand:+ start:1401 stop:2060 length:660 start_codon:yes stop_codon:yes gene_type:complete
MLLKKKDFIEIEFTGRTKDGKIFDSNIQEDLKKANLNIEPRPFIFCLGEGMFLKGVEDSLIKKEIGKYKIELPPEKAFGKRDAKMIQMIPMKVFREHQINPIKGTIFNFDGRLGKILTVSGGRVIVDFNNPVAGKDVVYDVNVLRKLDKRDEKIKALIEFFFRKDFKFRVKEKKLILDVDKEFKQFAGLFGDKFKDIFNLELEVHEVEEREKKEISEPK